MTLRRKYIFVVLSLIAVLTLYPAASRYLRAASLLSRITGSENALANFGRLKVSESTATVSLPDGSTPARLYTPDRSSGGPAMVLIHGIHAKGIAEPRLVHAARAIASTGVIVLTPELPGIADYRVTPDSVTAIGAAASMLRKITGGRPVGLMGLSFSGGLALMAAADPRYAPDIAYVVALGAHHDMARVARFLATGETTRPDGSVFRYPAHEYGALVLIYSSVERFFPPQDVEIARESIRLQLYEKLSEAKKRAAALSPEGRETMEALFQHKRDALTPQLLKWIDSNPGFETVSPRGHLADIRVPVLLLHGAGDEVIPATETLWLAEEIPPQFLHAALVSPAVSHVNFEGTPTWRDRLVLLWYMAHFLNEVQGDRHDP